MAASPEAFLDAFVRWPQQLMPDARERAAAARSQITIGCLSNTNALHADRHSSKEAVYELFDHRFLSNEIGLVKPDRDIYDPVLGELACPAAKALFLDDNQINVEAARGLAEARVALARTWNS